MVNPPWQLIHQSNWLGGNKLQIINFQQINVQAILGLNPHWGLQKNLKKVFCLGKDFFYTLFWQSVLFLNKQMKSGNLFYVFVLFWLWLGVFFLRLPSFSDAIKSDVYYPILAFRQQASFDSWYYTKMYLLPTSLH